MIYKFSLAHVSSAPSGIPVPLALPSAGSSSATPASDIPVSAPPTVKKPSYRLNLFSFFNKHTITVFQRIFIQISLTRTNFNTLNFFIATLPLTTTL